MPSKVWDEITYPFLSFNDCTIEVLKFIKNVFEGVQGLVSIDVCIKNTIEIGQNNILGNG